jgi:cytochrome c-type biogenesis protein
MAWLSNFFHELAINSSVPIFTALLLGLMAAVGPCTMATNFAAIAYIGRKVSDRKFAVLASLFYSLGRMVTYTIIGALIIGIGLEVPAIRNFLEGVGAYVLGPFLILGGILMLVADRFSFGGGGGRLAALGNKVSNWGLWGAFLMGAIFAFAFCPYSAVLYFAVMIPMAMVSTGGITFPAVFAIGTGLPVIVIGALLSAGVAAAASWISSISKAEKWIRIVMALVFIGVGIYVMFFQ